MLTALWILGLVAGCIGWGLLMSTVMYGVSPGFAESAGVAVGISGPLLLVTGVGSGLAYVVTQDRRKALWTWTILVVLGMWVLGIGAGLVLPVPSPPQK